MKIGIDAHRLLSEPCSSGATYLAAFLDGCAFIPGDKGASMTLYMPGDPGRSGRAVDLAQRAGARLRWPRYPCQPSRSYKHQLYWNQVVLPRLANEDELDVFFSPFHLTPIFLRRVPIVTTVHDLCFLSHPKSHSMLGRIVHSWEVWTARARADRLIAVSEFTFEEWAKYFPESIGKMRRIPTGLEMHAGLPAPRKQGRVPAFLWIGRNDARKNPELVFEGFRLYTELHAAADERLWVVVPTTEVGHFGELARRQGIHRRVDVLADLSEEEKWLRLFTAAGLLLPSSCEGFALPVLEAMQAGCIPIVPPFGPYEELLPPGFPRLKQTSARSIADLLGWVHLLDRDTREAMSSALQNRATMFNSVQMATRMLSCFEELTAQAEKPDHAARAEAKAGPP